MGVSISGWRGRCDLTMRSLAVGEGMFRSVVAEGVRAGGCVCGGAALLSALPSAPQQPKRAQHSAPTHRCAGRAPAPGSPPCRHLSGGRHCTGPPCAAGGWPRCSPSRRGSRAARSGPPRSCAGRCLRAGGRAGRWGGREGGWVWEDGVGGWVGGEGSVWAVVTLVGWVDEGQPSNQLVQTSQQPCQPHTPPPPPPPRRPPTCDDDLRIPRSRPPLHTHYLYHHPPTRPPVA